MPITNDWAMYKVLSEVMVGVIKKVSEKVTYDLSESILNNTYNYGGQNRYYVAGTKEPTYEFLAAFHFDEIVNNVNKVFSELFYDWENMMHFKPEYAIHGTGSDDMREKLAEILNIDGETEWMGKPRKPYWDIFIEDMFTNGKLRTYFDQAMREEFSKIGAQIL